VGIYKIAHTLLKDWKDVLKSKMSAKLLLFIEILVKVSCFIPKMAKMINFRV
jgi:hypothetical protein